MLICMKILGKTGHGDCCTLGVYLAARSSVRPCDRTRRSFCQGGDPPKGGDPPPWDVDVAFSENRSPDSLIPTLPCRRHHHFGIDEGQKEGKWSPPPKQHRSRLTAFWEEHRSTATPPPWNVEGRRGLRDAHPTSWRPNGQTQGPKTPVTGLRTNMPKAQQTS